MFLGNYQVDPNNLPERFEDSTFRLDANGGAIIGAIFSTAMVLLCLLVSGKLKIKRHDFLGKKFLENMTATIFWFIVCLAFLFFIYVNGEEYVNTPKLKQD